MTTWRQAVHAERERQQVQVLSLVTGRMRTAQPERVVESPVDRLGAVLVGVAMGPNATKFLELLLAGSQ